MRLEIREVANTEIGVWSATVHPQELERLSSPLYRGGGVNVLLVKNPAYDGEQNTLQFDFETAVLLSLGETERTVIIGTQLDEVGARSIELEVGGGVAVNADVEFIGKLGVLSPKKSELGKALLKAVRSQLPGALVYAEKSKRFIETPNNFWAISIQPRKENYRISVYGRPSKHNGQGLLQIKGGRNGYSDFILESESQLEAAVRVIAAANRLKQMKS